MHRSLCGAHSGSYVNLKFFQGPPARNQLNLCRQTYAVLSHNLSTKVTLLFFAQLQKSITTHKGSSSCPCQATFVSLSLIYMCPVTTVGQAVGDSLRADGAILRNALTIMSQIVRFEIDVLRNAFQVEKFLLTFDLRSQTHTHPKD